jgi:hypothetical protein
MKAVVMHEYGGPDVLKYEDVPDPVPGNGDAPTRCAHHSRPRPWVETGALAPDGRYTCVDDLARRVSRSECGRKRLQRSGLEPAVRQCGCFMQPSGLYTP